MTIPAFRPVDHDGWADDADARTDADFPCGHVTTTPAGIITDVNGTFERWTGHSGRALVGTAFVDLLTSSGQLFYETRYAAVLNLTGEVREVALTVRCADGSELPILVNAVVTTGVGGNAEGVRVAVFDATERQDHERQMLAARRAAEASEARVRVLQDASSAFAVVTSAGELSAALATSVGAALHASSVAVLLADGSGSLQLVAGDLHVRAILSAGVEALARRAIADGEIVSVSDLDQAAAVEPGLDEVLHRARLAAFSIAPLGGGERTSGAVVSLFGRDREFDAEAREIQAALARQAGEVLDRIRLRSELEHLALHDQLTGLANRTLLQERLDAAFASAARNERPLAVVFLDLDGFKAVNDGLGHRVGDQLLVEVAARIRSAARAGDAVARYGGDEFVVVCEDAAPDAALAIAERFLRELGRPMESIPAHRPVGASIGVAVWNAAFGATPTTDLLRAADEAMYASKRAGRNCISVVTV